MAKGSALKGALAGMPKGLQRMSPGVYRNPQGQLVGGQGQNLPNQRPQRPSMNVPQPQQQAQPQFDQLQYDAGMQAGNLARDTAGSYGGQGMQNPPPPSFAQGSVDQIMRDRLSQGMQFNPFQSLQGQQPPMQDLMYRSPAGTQVPNLGQVNGLPQQPQQAQPQQPQSISGLLQRFR